MSVNQQAAAHDILSGGFFLVSGRGVEITLHSR